MQLEKFSIKTIAVCVSRKNSIAIIPCHVCCKKQLKDYLRVVGF